MNADGVYRVKSKKFEMVDGKYYGVVLEFCITDGEITLVREVC